MSDWVHTFMVELKFKDAMSCLADAKLVAIEREYMGVARLLDSAIADLDLIGKLTGINGQKRIDGGAR